jgi:hypothetical protein
MLNEITQAYPFPAFMAELSSQSISTPSRLLEEMNVANLVAVTIGSSPAVVGN